MLLHHSIKIGNYQIAAGLLKTAHLESRASGKWYEALDKWDLALQSYGAEAGEPAQKVVFI
jgi:hypothetical protein